MDVETFLSSLLDALANRPFVQSVDLETEAIVVRGRVLLERAGQSHLSDGSLFAGSAEAQNSVPHAPTPPFSRAFAASLL